MATATESNEAAIFGRVLDLDTEPLSLELARRVLKLGFPHGDRARMNDLAAKARAGTLGPSERRELDNYVLVGDLLAVWHSKARQAIQDAKDA